MWKRWGLNSCVQIWCDSFRRPFCTKGEGSGDLDFFPPGASVPTLSFLEWVWTLILGQKKYLQVLRDIDLGTFLISLYTAVLLCDLHSYLWAFTFNSSLPTGQIHTCVGHTYAQVVVSSSDAHHCHEVKITRCILSLQRWVRYAVKDFMVKQKSHKISWPLLGQSEAFPSPSREIFWKEVVKESRYKWHVFIWGYGIYFAWISSQQADFQVKLLNQLMCYKPQFKYTNTQVFALFVGVWWL